MKLAAAVVLLALLVPAVSAVSILLPSEITGGENVRVYYNETTHLLFQVRGDASTRNVTFFLQSSNPAITFPNASTTFEVSNYSVKTIDSSLFGHDVISSPATITYGVRYSSSASGGIGFEDVNSATFKANVSCRTSNCNQSTYVPPYVPPATTTHTNTNSGSSGGGGGGGASTGYYPGSSYLPNGPANKTNSTPVATPTPTATSSTPPPATPAAGVQDVAAESGIASGVVDIPKQSASPILTNSAAPEAISAAVNIAGKSVALVLIALLVTLLVMQITLVKIVKGGVEI